MVGALGDVLELGAFFRAPVFVNEWIPVALATAVVTGDLALGEVLPRSFPRGAMASGRRLPNTSLREFTAGSRRDKRSD